MHDHASAAAGALKAVSEERPVLRNPIFIISGVPGAGKSMIARGLAKRFHRGILLPIEDLRDIVVSGYAGPLPQWIDETSVQFDLSFDVTSYISRRYSKARYAIVIEQVLYPKDVKDKIVPGLPAENIVRVFLKPDLEDVLKRNLTRGNKDFDTRDLTAPIRAMYPVMEHELSTATDWITLNSSGKTKEQTIDEILSFVDSDLLLNLHG